MNYAERIRTKLTAEFSPRRLEVIDESAQHIGHAGYKEGGETHFKVVMQADSLAGLSRVAQQRAVYKVLKQELAERVHALALEVSG